MMLAREIFRFGAVGVIGFVIDGGLLWVLVSNDASPIFARTLSFPAAVVTTWWLNRIWTFNHAAKVPPRRQLNLYLALQVVGALTNFMIYVVILSFIKQTPSNVLAALAVGAAVGMTINFTGSRRYIFKAPLPTCAKH